MENLTMSIAAGMNTQALILRIQKQNKRNWCILMTLKPARKPGGALCKINSPMSRSFGLKETRTAHTGGITRKPFLLKMSRAILLHGSEHVLSLIHISEPTRQAEISYAVFCLKKK